MSFLSFIEIFELIIEIFMISFKLKNKNSIKVSENKDNIAKNAVSEKSIETRIDIET
jgi:hypothetical protein